MSWISRAYTASSLFVRSALSRIGVLRSPPARLGITYGRVATPATAERDLSTMAKSPAVFAAVTRRGLTMGNYPIKGIYDGKVLTKPPLWLLRLRRLLETPHAEDIGVLFPSENGEHLIAQVVADLSLAGNAFVAVTVAGGVVSSLHRLHPQQVTLERREGAEYWVHRVQGRERAYPRDTVAHLRLLSWETSGAGELGTGAGEPLAHLVAAESKALAQTATVVAQGGADVMVTASSPAGRAFLTSPANREQVAREMTTALAGGPDGSRRIFVVGGELEMKDTGLRPADIRAPETLEVARRAELMALFVTPASIGSEAGTYATAVQQMRTQAENDETLASVIEAGLLRPLARHLARQGGGQWAGRADDVTARLDLSSHPGYAYIRTEAIDRMAKLVAMGWTPAQAAEIEGLDLPPPAGQPVQAPMASPPPAQGGQAEEAPRAPLGQSIGELLGRAVRADTPPATPAASPRWAALDARRARAVEAIAAASEEQLRLDAERYAEAATVELTAASRSYRAEVGATIYAEVDVDAILGDRDEDIRRWVDSLTPDWIESWTEGATAALEELGPLDVDVRVPGPLREDYDLLEAASTEVADYSRERVRAIVLDGANRGLTTSEIATLLREDQDFTRIRALRIARTEATRSQSSGSNARYREAEAAGLRLERVWLANPMARPTHAALDGEAVGVSEAWTFADGVTTTGPGLSGVPGEDINCRCAVSVREIADVA